MRIIGGMRWNAEGGGAQVYNYGPGAPGYGTGNPNDYRGSYSRGNNRNGNGSNSNRRPRRQQPQNPSGGNSSPAPKVATAGVTAGRGELGRFGLRLAAGAGLGALLLGNPGAGLVAAGLSPEGLGEFFLDYKSAYDKANENEVYVRGREGEAVDMPKDKLPPPTHYDARGNNPPARAGVRVASATRPPLPLIPPNPAATGGKYIRPITLAPRITRRAPGGDRFISLPNRRR